MSVHLNVISEAKQGAGRDVGVEALDVIHKFLLIDEQWTVRRPRGFTWWAHRFAHHLDVGRPVTADGVVLTRVTSRIPVLRDVRMARDEVDAVLLEANYYCDSYCYVYDAESRRIDSVQSALVHEQTLDWRPRLLASQFVIQLIHAEEQAPRLARKVKAKLASSRHPEAGRRRKPDDMLGVIRDVILPSGLGTNRFANKFEFDTIVEEMHRGNAASFGASDTGVAVEVPFSNGTALIMLDTLESHRLVGQGLWVIVQLPIWPTHEEGARLAAWLNRKEADGDLLTNCIGAWSVSKRGKAYALSHKAFIPNALHMAGLSIDSLRAAAISTRAINALLNPNEPEPDVWEVVAKRLGIKLPVVRRRAE